MQIDLKKITPPPLVNSTCTECGALIPAEFQSCDIFLQFVLTDLRSAPPRLLIDAFGMQHPKRACKSAKSYAGYFSGLCCGVEYAGSKRVYAALQRWLSGTAEHIGESVAIEVKAKSRPTKRDLRGLAALTEELPLKRRVVVCSTQKAYREDDGTEMVPAEDFFRALWRGDIL